MSRALQIPLRLGGTGGMSVVLGRGSGGMRIEVSGEWLSVLSHNLSYDDTSRINAQGEYMYWWENKATLYR